MPHIGQNFAVTGIFSPHSIQNFTLEAVLGSSAIRCLASSATDNLVSASASAGVFEAEMAEYSAFHLSTVVSTSEMLSRLTSMKSFISYRKKSTRKGRNEMVCVLRIGIWGFCVHGRFLIGRISKLGDGSLKGV